MKQCEYQNGTTRCKNWVSSQDEDIRTCPLHAGVTRREMSTFEKATQIRFEQHEKLCTEMDDDQLSSHILQLQSLLEDVKLRQQAASLVRTKRLREKFAKGELTREQLDDMQALRGSSVSRQKVSRPENAPSKEEKEILKYMKLGFTRDKAMKMLGL